MGEYASHRAAKKVFPQQKNPENTQILRVKANFGETPVAAERSDQGVGEKQRTPSEAAGQQPTTRGEEKKSPSRHRRGQPRPQSQNKVPKRKKNSPQDALGHPGGELNPHTTRPENPGLEKNTPQQQLKMCRGRGDQAPTTTQNRILRQLAVNLGKEPTRMSGARMKNLCLCILAMGHIQV